MSFALPGAGRPRSGRGPPARGQRIAPAKAATSSIIESKISLSWSRTASPSFSSTWSPATRATNLSPPTPTDHPAPGHDDVLTAQCVVPGQGVLVVVVDQGAVDVEDRCSGHGASATRPPPPVKRPSMRRMPRGAARSVPSRWRRCWSCFWYPAAAVALPPATRSVTACAFLPPGTTRSWSISSDHEAAGDQAARRHVTRPRPAPHSGIGRPPARLLRGPAHGQLRREVAPLRRPALPLQPRRRTSPSA